MEVPTQAMEVPTQAAENRDRDLLGEDVFCPRNRADEGAKSRSGQNRGRHRDRDGGDIPAHVRSGISCFVVVLNPY